MHELTHLLQDMGVIFLLSVGVILLCHRIKIPAIIGFLFTGILAGPYGLGLIDDVHKVELMAEIGVVLLLFTIGMEFSIGELWKIRRPVLLGGSVQVLGTIGFGAGVLLLSGLAPNQAIFGGFLLSLSSTAIVLKLLQEKAEMDAPQGRISLAVLIFQDVAAIPMLLLAPVLAGVQSNSQAGLGPVLLKTIGVMVLLGVASRYIIPFTLARVVRTRIRELFLISIAGICLGIAWLSASMGLSLALGAFIAGLIISESEYSHQAMGYIMPFRDVFTSLFFVSTGMLLNLKTLMQSPLQILILLSVALVIKIIVAGGASLLLGYSLRISALVGLMLCQVGEFSLVVGKLGYSVKLLDSGQYQIFLSLSIISMMLTPLFFFIAPRLANRLPGKGSNRTTPVASDTQPRLLIVGYGIGGRNLGRAAQLSGIPYRVLEMNWETVRREREKGVPIHYGDATQEDILNHLGLPSADTLVLMISDAAATRRVVELVKRLYPAIWVVVRTRFVSEIDALYQLGANEVIAEEFESSIEIFARVMQRSLVPQDQISALIAEMRNTHYGVFRHEGQTPELFEHLRAQLPDFQIAAVRIPEGSELDGVSLADTQLRNRFDVTVLAVTRGHETHPHPAADWRLVAQDVLMVMGRPEAIRQLDRSLKDDALA
ncbi:MAG: cation:proton antiporter [Candidatus Sericytochromatia bacterium]